MRNSNVHIIILNEHYYYITTFAQQWLQQNINEEMSDNADLFALNLLYITPENAHPLTYNK